MDKLIFMGTKAKLPTERKNAFYLCTDTREMYFGADLYTEPVRLYTGDKPQTPAQGVLYINETTGAGDVWTGTAWKSVLKAVVTTIGDGANDETLPTAKAVKDYVDGKVADAANDVTALNGKVTTLIGNDADKSVRDIANEELAAQLIPENANEALNTLQEIAAWIQKHPDDASAMNTAITNLTKLVGTLPEGAQAGTVVAYIKEYCDKTIEALKIGDYAKAADLSAAVERITTLEGKMTAAEGKLTTLTGDETTDGSVKKALSDAKAYTDEKNTAMDTRVSGIEDALTVGTF